MANLTSYAVLPFLRNEHGELCQDEAVECQSQALASRARALAAAKAGAAAPSMTGDPDIREFADAVILARVGELPADPEMAWEHKAELLPGCSEVG